MTPKSLTTFLLGFAALCCLLQSTHAQEECQLRLFPNDNDLSYHLTYDENNNVAPFTGLVWNGNQQTETQGTYPSLRAVEGSSCGRCYMLVYSTATFSGQSETYLFMDQPQFFFPFDVQSFTLHCPSSDEEEEEYTEEGADYEDVFEWVPIDSTEVNSTQISKIRNTGIDGAIVSLKNERKIPQGQYQVTTIHNSWIASIFNGYKFDVDISNGLGSQYKLKIYLAYDLETDWWIFYQYNSYRLN